MIHKFCLKKRFKQLNESQKIYDNKNFIIIHEWEKKSNQTCNGKNKDATIWNF